MSRTCQKIWSSLARLCVLTFLCLHGALVQTEAAITLVQHTSRDAGTTTSATLAFPASTTTGNFIAVVIRAGRSGQVFTVTDSRGNVYQLAVRFDVTGDLPNGSTLGILYVPAISGGATTVTVSMPTAGTLRFAILEYAGLATTSVLDGATATQGTSAAPSSGTVTTAANGDLLLGAIMTGNPATFGAGSGYIIEERVPAAPNTKLITEDRIQGAAGAAAASASLGGTDVWGAAVAAFRAAGGVGGGTAPSITNLNPTQGVAGTPGVPGTVVTITGTNFGPSQDTSSSVAFNGTPAQPTGWSDTSIQVPVPMGATTGSVVVTTAAGQATSPAPFTVLPATPSAITAITLVQHTS